MFLDRDQGTVDSTGTTHTNGLTRRAFLERAAILGMSSGALLSALSACGDTGSTATTSGPVTLTSWDYYTPEAEALLVKRYASFTSTHPNIKFQISHIPYPDMKQKILQGAAAGTLPDLIYVDSLDAPSIASQGIAVDLTDRIKAWGQIGQYFPGTLNTSVFQGKNYGLPNNTNDIALFYNVDMLAKAGVQPPTTWAELRSSAKALTKNGVYGFAVSAANNMEGTFNFLPFLRQAGADWDTLDSPAAASALQFLVNLIQDGSLSKEAINWAQSDSIGQFISGSAAMCQNGMWQIATLNQQAKFKWKVVPLPKGQSSSTSLGGEVLMIPKTSKYVDQVWQFIQYAQDPQNLKPYLVSAGALPGRNDVAQDTIWQHDPVLSVFANSLAFAKSVGAGTKNYQASDLLTPALQSALTGQKSPADALRQVSASIKSLLSS
jgi:multiple sugar transport system substrate-binding protein